MPLDASAQTHAQQTLACWHALRDAYDAIEHALAAPDPADLRALAARIVTLEGELEPRIAELASARSRTNHPAPVLTAIWGEIDGVVSELASRQPRLVRAALAARSATVQRLDELRVARDQVRRYAGPPSAGGRFTSRSA
jgi:hypothetical protein